MCRVQCFKSKFKKFNFDCSKIQASIIESVMQDCAPKDEGGSVCSIYQYVFTSGLEFARRVLAFHFRFLTECRFIEEKNIKQKLANMYIKRCALNTKEQ